jgi:5-formyltetrahydrofolate cyclo-ligase
MDSSRIDMVKQEWRIRMSAVRDAVPADDRIAWSERLCRNVEQEVLNPMRQRLGRTLTVCVYAAYRSEADPLPLILHCWTLGDTVVAPRMSGGSVELRIVRDPSDWRPGRWGVPEPDPSRTLALPAEHLPDIVLVPGLAFHVNGSRLGYGGGYYDRFYADERSRGNDRTWWIGFAWSIQLAQHPLPREAHDLVLDAVATDEAVLWRHRGGE